MIGKKLLYEILDGFIIPNMPLLSINLWKKLCLYKRILGIELGYFTKNGEYIKYENK